MKKSEGRAVCVGSSLLVQSHQPELFATRRQARNVRQIPGARGASACRRNVVNSLNDSKNALPQSFDPESEKQTARCYNRLVMNTFLIDGNHQIPGCWGSWGDDGLSKSLRDYYDNVRNINRTLQVLRFNLPWTDHYVSELAPVVQSPSLAYFLNIDALETLDSLNAAVKHLERKVRALWSFGSWAEKLIDCIRYVQSFIEDRIKLVLTALRIPVFAHEVLTRETDFFEYHGCGRPPRILGRALKAGLSQITGRMRSSPAFA